MFSASDYIFPVGAVNKKGDRNTDVYGTASYLGDKCFITAGHVIKNATANKLSVLGFMSENQCRYFFINQFEIFDDIDIGIIQLDMQNIKVKSFLWDLKLSYMLSEVHTIGFPHGHSIKENEFYTSVRALKGYVVSLSIDSFYELSFFCPKGISGAPLLNKAGNLVGIIIGNTGVEINVCTEVEKDGDQIYTKDVITYWGQAIGLELILNKRSNLFNMIIKDFLRKNRYLIEK